MIPIVIRIIRANTIVISNIGSIISPRSSSAAGTAWSTRGCAGKVDHGRPRHGRVCGHLIVPLPPSTARRRDMPNINAYTPRHTAECFRPCLAADVGVAMAVAPCLPPPKPKSRSDKGKETGNISGVVFGWGQKTFRGWTRTGCMVASPSLIRHISHGRSEYFSVDLSGRLFRLDLAPMVDRARIRSAALPIPSQNPTISHRFSLSAILSSANARAAAINSLRSNRTPPLYPRAAAAAVLPPTPASSSFPGVPPVDRPVRNQSISCTF